MDEPKITEVSKSLQDILKEGFNWQSGLSTVIVDLLKRVDALEKKQ